MVRAGTFETLEVVEEWEYHADAVDIMMKVVDRSVAKELEGI